MFTGIIQTTGKVKKLTANQLTIEVPTISRQLKKGGSISVDGACLTVVGLSSGSFTADVMPETRKKTIISSYKIGSSVNLELPLKADGRFEGHIVTGHIDGVGELTDVKRESNAYVLTIKIPARLIKYIVQKGSVAINGISLTVADIKNNSFTVSIIPHTWKITNLHTLKMGSKVNLETDILAKYAEKLINST